MDMQRLFFGSRRLNETETVGNITTASPVPILLDMMTGTSTYNRTLSVAQALEAYAALATQQAFIGDQFRRVYAKEVGIQTEESADSIESVVYREMFQSINESLYQKYALDIADAMLAEVCMCLSIYLSIFLSISVSHNV